MKICITGASSGIGKSLTEYFLETNNIVWGIARRKEMLQNTKNKYPENFFFDVCNVENYSEVLNIKKKMEKAGFLPDVIILGAAINSDDIKPIFNLELYKKTFSINLFGAVNFVDIFIKDFLKNQKGQFIALSSISAFRPNKRGISYPATKSALSLTFRGLDLEYRKRNIYFSTVYLGPVETQMWEGKKSWLVSDPENIAKQIAKLIKTKKSVSFIPFFSTFLYRTSRLFPDSFYAFLSEHFLK